jgi:hypothetical protein
MKRILVPVVMACAGMLHAVQAAPIPVRFTEGLTHGFLILRDVNGKTLAQGKLVQSLRDDVIHKRMIFRFKDGSVFDERVTFTEQGRFALVGYELSQKGPAFPADTEIVLTAGTGAYKVITKDHKGGREKVHEGQLDLPSDVYNGMIFTVLKDLEKGSGALIHLVAFMPEPKLIELELQPAGETKFTVGEQTKSAQHYLMKPRLGLWLKFLAKLLGRMPEDLHAWIMIDEVPAFAGFEGSLTTTGPVWRIEVVSATRSD